MLNGGLKKWKAENRVLEGGEQEQLAEVSNDNGKWCVPEPKRAITDINLVHQTAFYITKKATDWQILDARAAPRFNGEVAEPRPGVRSGHISGSLNLPFNMLVDE